MMLIDDRLIAVLQEIETEFPGIKASLVVQANGSASVQLESQQKSLLHLDMNLGALTDFSSMMTEVKDKARSALEQEVDEEWEQERPIWEAYKRDELDFGESLTLDDILEQMPELRPYMSKDSNADE